MHPAKLLCRLIGAGLTVVLSTSLNAADAPLKRVPWTTSHIHGSPEPPKPYVARRSYPKLEFKEGLEVVFEPQAKRWFVLERLGRILSFPAAGDPDHADLAADIAAKHPDLDYLYSLAFHPKYAENHFVFITYTRGPGIDDGTKLSRFVVKDESGIPKLDPTSEKIILTWRSGGHNGANLRFGPDGFLYVSTGDSEVPSPPDPLNTGQDISDLLSSILRIDVNHTDPPLAYRIPGDNPFTHTPGARHEVWAYGLRNPWKMSFDRATGRLWCGDVGWELWESIHLIERGGNYGWSAMEASQPVRADAPKAPTPIRPPIVAHSHDEAASITGGNVYHGKKFPELDGAYIYGDWVTGKMWALWYDGKQVTRHEEIADTHHKIVAFGEDADGELVYLHYDTRGTMHHLERNPVTNHAADFPRKLSQTGLFSSLPGLTLSPQEGVRPFLINSPMWQDGANMDLWQTDNALRWPPRLIALPGRESIHTTVESTEQKDGTVAATYKTIWPKDAVLVKTQFVNLKSPKGDFVNPGPCPIETQVLHFDGEDWNAYSYRWNEAGTDADLVPASGDERTVVIPDKSNPAKFEKYQWRFQSRAECIRCHNSWTGYALAFNPAQLNCRSLFLTIPKPFPYPKADAGDQADYLQELNLVDSTFFAQTNLSLAHREPGFRLPSGSLQDAARAYLHSNCSHCHRQNAGGAVNMMLNAELLLGQTRTVGVIPQQGGLGLEKPKLIDPGNPWNSVICIRLAKTGTGHMPLIGPHEVDVRGLKLIEDWIARMGDAARTAGDLLPKAWNPAELRAKLASVEGAMQVLRAVDDQLIIGELRQTALDIAWNSPLPTVRDLFDRFKPDSQRVETLGMNPPPAKILALKGDAARGAQLVAVQGKLSACFACHIVAGTGRDFGPDLSHVASRLKREQIVESLLLPSKVIAPGYGAVSVTSKSGAAQVGFIVKEDAAALILKIPTGQSVTIPRADVREVTKLPNSLMPEGLLQSLTAQEAADVVGYLGTLK